MSNEKRELELKFLAGHRILTADGKCLVPGQTVFTDIEQVYLREGWRARKSSPNGSLERSTGVRYELNKKVRKSQTEKGVDSTEIESIVPAELYNDLVSTWRDDQHAPVHKIRGTLIPGEAVAVKIEKIEFDQFVETWVIPDARYLVEVEYVPVGHDPELAQAAQIEELVRKLFEDVRNVSGDLRYTNQEIARRIYVRQHYQKAIA